VTRELELLHDEMRQLKELRQTIDTRIAWLHRRMYSPKLNGKSSVDTTPLIPFIQQCIDNHESLIDIADRCNVSDKTLAAALRGEAISELSADRIVTGLGIPHRYAEIVPMPPESKYYEE
jgi:hypothetical protein